jgi:hypothetical protein
MTTKRKAVKKPAPKANPIEQLIVNVSVKLGDTIHELIGAIFEAVDVGEIIAEYDPGWAESEIDEICENAGNYLVQQLLGGLCYNALDVQKFSEQMLQSAFDQLASAAETAERYPGPSSDSNVDAKMRWVTQQLVQKAYRGATIHTVMGAYQHIVGKPYSVSKRPAPSEKARTATHEGAKKLLKMRAASK